MKQLIIALAALLVAGTTFADTTQKTLLGKWWKTNGEESIEFFDDGTAVIEKGERLTEINWKARGGDRLQLTVPRAGGSMYQITVDEKGFTLTGGDKLFRGRYFKKKSDAAGAVIKLKPGQTLTRGAIKFAFLRVVNAKKTRGVSNPGFLICYRVENISDTILVEKAGMTAFIGFGESSDEFGNKLEPNYMMGDVGAAPRGVCQELSPEQLKPGQVLTTTIGVSPSPIATAQRFTVKKCQVYIGRTKEAASFHLEFTRADAVKGTEEAAEESRKELAAIEEVLATRTLAGKAQTKDEDRWPCEIHLASYDKAKRTFAGTMHWPTRGLPGPSEIHGSVVAGNAGWEISFKETAPLRPRRRGELPGFSVPLEYTLRLEERSGKHLLCGGRTNDSIQLELASAEPSPAYGIARTAELRKRRAQLESERERPATTKENLLNAIRGKQFHGRASMENGQGWECRILFSKRCDAGRITGAMHWPTLKGTTVIVGKLTMTREGWTIVFTETQYYKGQRGQVALGTEYILVLKEGDSKELTGFWKGSGASGDIAVTLFTGGKS